MESLVSSVLDNINWVTALLALAVCLFFYAYILWSHMPPGPTGLPYLGYYPFLGNDFHKQLHDMTKKYGDVFCFKCTGQMYVYLGTVQAVKEAHITKSDCFTGRSMNFSLFSDAFGGGVAYENGEKWKELRKFFVQKLKEFGLGRKTQESLISDFLQRTVNTIKKKDGENFDAMDFFTDACCKAIFQMLLSRTKVDDDDIKTFNEAYCAVTEPMVGPKILLAGPLLKYVMLYLQPGLRRYRKGKQQVENMLSKIIEEHEKDFDKDNIRDLVDCYISERREVEQKGDPRSEIFSDKALVNTLVQLIGDGGFSVGFMVALVLKELYSRPEMQKEIQREIDDTVGRNRFPSWDDRSRMPYTNATISESFRKSDFFLAFPSLECTKETTVGDCRVPKGTITLVNFWSAFRDPDLYEQPEKFDPTRFLLNEERKPRCEVPILFGVGKRSCIGEPLVMMETFLFVTTVLQNFDLHPPKEDAEKKKESADLNIVFRATPRTS